MSKIFDAYRKQVGQTLDNELPIERIGQVGLYSPPLVQQQDEFSRLANRILNLRLDSRGTVIAFSSSSSGEGSSFVSYSTACILARVYQQRVAWLDLNLLSPQAKLKGLDQVTVANLLQDPDLVRELPVAESPMLIPAGGNLLSVRGLFADKNYNSVLAGLADRFDFVVLDLPPVLATTDTALMAEASDGMLLIIEQKHLKWEVIEHGLQSLRDKGVNILGSIINRREFELPKVIYDRL